MITFRRLFLYAWLMLPVAYVMGITFAERRILFYVLMLLVAAPILLTYLLHVTLRHQWRRYQRFLLRRAGRLRRALPWIARLAQIGMMLVPTLILVPIGIGLTPAVFLALGLLALLWLIVQASLRPRFPGWLRLDVVALMLVFVYAALAAIGSTYFGSSDGACACLADDPALRPIISRDDLAASALVDSCFPYDVKSDPARDRLFFTLKQRRSGFVKSPVRQEIANDAIGMTSFAAPDFAAADLLPILGDSSCRYPQRITVNPQRQEIYVVVLDIDGDHAIYILDYAAGLRLKHRLAVDFEPIRAYFNERNGDLLVLGYEGVVGRYDLTTYERREFYHLGRLGFIGLLDTLVPNRAGDAYYASVVSPLFLLLDAGNFQIRESARVGVPTIGLDYDPLADRVYAAATLTREILVLNGRTLAIEDRIPTGTTVRELYLDHVRRRLVTAGYADGYLDVYALDSMRRLARVFVGKLARGIHLEEQSGRVFVTSSCGLFEVNVARLLGE